MLDDIAVYFFLVPTVFALTRRAMFYFDRRRWRLSAACTGMALFIAGNAVIRVGTEGGSKTIDQTATIVQGVGSDIGFFIRSLLAFIAIFLVFWAKPFARYVKRVYMQAKKELRHDRQRV